METLRKLILALLVAGMAGLLAELFFLDHYELLWQWAPIVALLAGLALAIAVGVRPSPATLHPFRVVMTLFVLVGLVGIGLHLAGNLEFEREMDPSAGGFALFRDALSGAFPSLAPGALVQLGLLGLIHAWRHPALGESGGDDTEPSDTA
jgi:hypothetical protein